MDDLKLDELKPLIKYGALAVIGLTLFRRALDTPKACSHSYSMTIVLPCEQGDIPIVGSSGFLSSYRDALKFHRTAPEFIQRGYEQYPEGIFRIARLYRWEYIVCGPKLTKEVGNAPENVLSFYAGLEEVRLCSLLLAAISQPRSSADHSRFDFSPPKMFEIDSSAEARFTMGREITEDPYTRLTVRTNLTRNLHTLFPEVRDQIVCAFDDVLQLQGSEWKCFTMLPTTMDIVARVGNRLFAFTHALFDLTTYPEHFLPMREEVERVITEEGWTKAALNNMVKIDSFLRESQRLSPNGPLVMQRRVVSRDGFRFSDGTVLPYGAFLSVAGRPVHYDASKYENAATFDGFRFERERVEHTSQHDLPVSDNNQDVFKRNMTSVDVDHLPFGTGKHACPGRFFVATELKAMLAHLVINYDIKAEVEGVRPPDITTGTTITPNPTGKVYFRKRQ
ncbi:cytochrome P450 [Mycena haematopus]|nr:cytochrome P450 [Mycena haematopus]